MIPYLIITGLVVVVITLYNRCKKFAARYNDAVKEKERIVCKMRSDYAKKERDTEHFRVQIVNQYERKYQARLGELRSDYMLKQQKIDKEYVEKEQELLSEIKEKEQKLSTEYDEKEQRLYKKFKEKEQKLNEDFSAKSKKLDEMISQHGIRLQIDLEKLKEEYRDKEQELKDEFDLKNKKLRELLDASHISSFSASMYADIETYVFKEAEDWLTFKNRPAYATAAEIKKKVNEECKVYLQQYREMLYKYEYLMNSFPELEAYVDNINDLKEISYDNLQQYGEEYDRTHNYLTKEQYESLSETERNQLALDKYVDSNNKSDWQIGRDYELYCGYKLREAHGIVSVIQHGIEKRLEDLGIDIIAEDNSNVYIIQCKYWSQHREIHEKHIAQLYGSAKVYEIKNEVLTKRVIPVFITNTELSGMAKIFAKSLDVRLRCWQLEAFPRIKCNISRNDEKIYHLPFDQQYDTTRIYGNGDFYAWTVEEAENQGYRRAYRWSGN